MSNLFPVPPSATCTVGRLPLQAQVEQVLVSVTSQAVDGRYLGGSEK